MPNIPISRRQLLARLAGSAAAVAIVPILPGPGAAPPSDVAELAPASLWPPYPGTIVIDGLAEPFDTGSGLPLDEAVKRACRRSGLTAVNFTVVGPGAGFEETVAAIARVQRAAQSDSALFRLVLGPGDIGAAKRERRLGLILGFQTTEMIGSELARIETFRNLGVRIMQMTYNQRNLWGDGCLEPGNAGLSRAGRDALERMNALGVAVDVSHSGQKTTADAIAASRKPVLISHTGCNAVYRHPRNKDDADLRAMADRGGVVGIYLMPFLDGGTGELTPEMLYAHVEHALQICGPDHVGIGSDQGIEPISDGPEYRAALRKEVEDRRRRGVSAPGESPDRPPFIPALNSERRMDRIAEGLSRRGQPDSVIAKVLGENFQRCLGEVWDGSVKS